MTKNGWPSNHACSARHHRFRGSLERVAQVPERVESVEALERYAWRRTECLLVRIVLVVQKRRVQVALRVIDWRVARSGKRRNDA